MKPGTGEQSKSKYEARNVTSGSLGALKQDCLTLSGNPALYTFVGKGVVSAGPGKRGEDHLSGSRACPDKGVPQPADTLGCE